MEKVIEVDGLKHDLLAQYTDMSEIERLADKYHKQGFSVCILKSNGLWLLYGRKGVIRTTKKITKSELKEILMKKSLQTALDIHAYAFSSKEYVINDLLDYSNGQLTEVLKRYGWDFEIITKK